MPVIRQTRYICDWCQAEVPLEYAILVSAVGANVYQQQQDGTTFDLLNMQGKVQVEPHVFCSVEHFADKLYSTAKLYKKGR